MAEPVRAVEVAERAGVSVATVSAVLAGKAEQRRISPATAARVQAMARELGYRPNVHASSLRSRQTRCIGLIQNGAMRPSAACDGMLLGAMTAARSAGWYCSAGGAIGALSEAGSAAADIRSGRYEGFIVDMTLERNRQADLLKLYGPDLVLMNHEGDTPFPSLGFDRDAGRLAALRRLAALGHRRVVMLDVSQELQGEDGVQAEPQSIAGVELHALLIPGADDERLATAAWASRWLPGRAATAVICASDLQAVGLRDACVAAGVDLPGGLSIVAGDGSLRAHFGFAAIGIDYRGMGAAAVTTLIDGILTRRRLLQTPPPERRVLPCAFLDGGSIGPVSG